MVNAVEEPSATVITGTHGVQKQRTETRSHRRNHVPMMKGKAHAIVDDSGQRQAGDSGREKGGTQKFPIIRGNYRRWVLTECSS